MSVAVPWREFLLGTAGALALGVAVAAAQVENGPTLPIDLPTALRLAGAQNLDIQIARQAVEEAEADRLSAIEQFFPWLAPGIAYHRRDGLAQAIPAGMISDTNFYSYQPGVTIAAEAVLGDAIYKTLAAKQMVRAAERGLEAQRNSSVLSAAQGYFDLANDQALVAVARQALETSELYEQQLREAVSIGVAFKGDELRVQAQTEVYRIGLRQALERQRIAAARLARILHLDPAVELVSEASGLAPLQLYDEDASQEELIDRALSDRPEMKREQALVSAARHAEDGAVYGPLIPSVGAQIFAGALGGGHDDEASNFGAMQDYVVGLGWRIGPGGLFDIGRIRAGRARLAAVQLANAKLRDAITTEVVERLARAKSLFDQLALTKRNLATANDTLRLTRERKRYGVGVVLEDIQAQQSLNRARADYFTTIAEFNKAQFELNQALGGSPEPDRWRPGASGAAGD